MVKPINTTRYGYKFRQKTWYSKFHLGLDLIAKTGTPILAPEKGVIRWMGFGVQGGKQMHFLGESGVLHRFLHLDSYAQWHKGAIVEEGEIVAICGNTGKYTTGSHLHWDLSRGGKLELNNIDNFIDPLKWLKTVIEIPENKDKDYINDEKGIIFMKYAELLGSRRFQLLTVGALAAIGSAWAGETLTLQIAAEIIVAWVTAIVAVGTVDKIGK